MTLPQWIDRLKKQTDLGNIAWTQTEAEQSIEALSIAWEALEDATHELDPMDIGLRASKAMRKIEEMGQ